MYNRPVEILLVEPDADLAAMIRDCVRASTNGNVTVAASAAAALGEELTTRHDVLLVANRLPDANWGDLLSEIRQNNRGPAILLAQGLSMDEALSALRAGVMDVVEKPFELTALADLVEQAGGRAFRHHRKLLRNQRLRKLASRIIHERRDLRQRIDLICRDFVHAYRRLAQRVTDAELISRD